MIIKYVEIILGKVLYKFKMILVILKYCYTLLEFIRLYVF